MFFPAESPNPSSPPPETAGGLTPAPPAAAPDPAVTGHRLPGARRSTAVLITLALCSVGAAIYLSPSAPAHHAQASGSGSGVAADESAGVLTRPPSATPSVTAHPSPHKRPVGHGRGSTPTYVPVARNYGVPGTAITRRIVESVPAHPPTGTPTAPKPRSVSPTPKTVYCTDFHWQQDAEAVYVSNLSDPYGLDGAPGPHNGDGLACTQLPVDPSRSPSTPVDGYVPPPPAGKAALAQPAARYFGVAEDGLPGSTPLFNSLSTQVGKAPSALSWFSTWDQPFSAAKVQASWSHGALPVVTWMTLAGDANSATAGTYTLANIVAGRFDNYLLGYAGAVLRTGLPVAIRFDHEMNGNWYPWSGGLKANQGAAGEPNLYVQAWRHIWNVFDSVGANSDIIWLWSPVRVDNIRPGSTKSGYKYETSLAENYPGDRYVDWVGMSAYQYKPSDGWTYEATFRNTLSGLRALCSKPIFISETGATESVGPTNYSAQKAQWTQQTLAGLASEPDVVGFSWFNNTVNDVHQVDGLNIRTDWQFSSSQAALDAFKAGLLNPAYSSGLMPDTAGGTAK